MRSSSLAVGRFRWSVLAIVAVSLVSLLVATSGAQAVSGATGQAGDPNQVASAMTASSTVNNGQQASTSPAAPLDVRLQLMPQGLPDMLRAGIAVRVSSNEAADGIAFVSISRGTAKRARIEAGTATSVVIGRGTIWQVKDGIVNLRLKLSHATVAKLNNFQYLTLSVRLALVGPAGDHLAIDAAGRY